LLLMLCGFNPPAGDLTGGSCQQARDRQPAAPRQPVPESTGIILLPGFAPDAGEGQHDREDRHTSVENIDGIHDRPPWSLDTIRHLPRGIRRRRLYLTTRFRSRLPYFSGEAGDCLAGGEAGVGSTAGGGSLTSTSGAGNAPERRIAVRSLASCWRWIGSPA